jgi:ATP/ADP translocase
MLSRIGIRPEEKQISFLLFSNMFFSGLTIGMVRVCAYTLFLAHFEAEQLALIAILLAVFGTLATLAISWLTRHLSVRGYIFTILAVILAGLLAFRLSLANAHSSDLIFFLPLWFELVYMLISLQFTALLTRLFNVRQAKRLAGLTRSGEFLAEILGGLSVVFLLTLIEVEDLLLVAFLAVLCVFCCVQITVKAFQSRLQITTTDVAAEEHKANQLLTLLKHPYVRLISVCYALYIFAYFFLDVAFYDLASRQYPDQNELAAFLGQFFATTGFLTLISLAFVFAPFLKKFGILGGVIVFPVVVASGSFLVGASDLAGLPIAMLFSIMVLTNGFRFVLQSSIWRPSISILFQVMPDRHRYHSNTLIEGIVDPLSGGLAGICLFFLTGFLGWESVSLLFLLAALLVFWIIGSFIIRRMYLSNLVVTLQKRKLGELTLSELDKRSLEIIENSLDSEHPAEVLYCLDLLEGLHHDQLPELISKVLDHKSANVRMDALRRIERLQLDSISDQVAKMFARELDVEVLGQVFITYGALGSQDTLEKLKPYLQISTYHLHKGALVGLLRFDRGNRDAILHLHRLAHSSIDDKRRLAATVAGEIGDEMFSGLLLELLEDPDLETVKNAILAAADIDDKRLIQPLVSKLTQLQLQPLIARVLQQKGQIALPELETVLFRSRRSA